MIDKGKKKTKKERMIFWNNSVFIGTFFAKKKIS